eukprot:Partr_v1_DN28580_c1_g1_i2_m72509 putative Regulator of G-protein signaling
MADSTSKDTKNPESAFSNIQSKGDVFAPSFATKLLDKKPDKLTNEEIAKIKEGSVKIILETSDMKPPGARPVGKQIILNKRYAKMEKWMSNMRDPADGVQFGDRRKFLDVMPSSAPGSLIMEWIRKNCNCNYSHEARQTFQMLLNHGYVIPMDPTNYAVTEDPEVYFTFQSDFFYCSRWWDASEYDYAVYLLRRSSKNGGNMLLNSEEIDRFYKIQKQFGAQWKNIHTQCERQKVYVNNLDKRERRLLELREFAFWRNARPLSVVSATVEAYMEEQQLQKKHLNEEQHFASLAPVNGAAYLEKRVRYLETQINLFRKENSASCKALIRFAESWLPLDPLLISRKSTSPWVLDANAEWPVDKSAVPSGERVFLWTTSFRDMLEDDLGLKFFSRFLEKDLATENLKFYLDCQQLDQIQNREDYYAKCKEIFDEYINFDSPSEININANMRKAIIEKFKEADPLTLDIQVYHGAMEHVTELMVKDRYPKFINSDEVKALLDGFTPRKTITFSQSASTMLGDGHSGFNAPLTADSEKEKTIRRSGTSEGMRPGISSDRFIRKSTTAEKSMVSSASKSSVDSSNVSAQLNTLS